MPYCTNCGSKHELTARFCASCGHAVAAAPVDPPLEEKPEEKTVVKVDDATLPATAKPLDSASPVQNLKPVGLLDVFLGLAASALLLAMFFLPQYDDELAKNLNSSVWILIVVCFISLAKRRKWKRPWLTSFAWIFGVAILGIAGVAGKAGFERYQRHIANQHADEVGERLLSSIEKFDPATGQQMRNEMDKPGQFGKLFKPVFVKAIARTSDEALIAFTDATGTIVSPNGVLDQNRCYSVANATSWSNLSPAESDAMSTAMVHIFDAATPLDQMQASRDDKGLGKTLMSSITNKIDPNGLFDDADAVAKKSHDAICNHYLALMSEIHQLPSPDRAAVLRFMMSPTDDSP